MTETNFRALCAELVEAWYGTSDFDFNDFGHAAADIVTRARAALAEQLVEPTDDLSPAAQSVLDAATVPTGDFCLENVNEIAAAALRAAADGCDPDWLSLTVLHHLYSIADELEQLND